MSLSGDAASPAIEPEEPCWRSLPLLLLAAVRAGTWRAGLENSIPELPASYCCTTSRFLNSASEPSAAGGKGHKAGDLGGLLELRRGSSRE